MQEEEDHEGGAGYGSGGSDIEQEVPSEQGNSEEEEEGVAMFSGHTPMSSGRTREKRKRRKGSQRRPRNFFDVMRSASPHSSVKITWKFVILTRKLVILMCQN